MLQKLKQLLQADTSQPAHPPAEEPTTAAQSEIDALVESVEALLRSESSLMLENQLSGWFNEETGELYQGFPINADDTVLDIGCGDSPFITFCAGRGAEVIFSDIDQPKIASVNQKLADSPARAIYPLVSDSNPLPLVDGTASRVVAMEVLEHVDDPESFMAELVRVGKPGAKYLLTVPGYLHEVVQKDLAPPSYFEKPNHIRIFEPGQLEELATRSGLQVDSAAGYGFYWSVWWYMFWACEQELGDPLHPILENWTRSWLMLLKTPQGPRIKAVLDDVMPKSYAIVATKPMV